MTDYWEDDSGRFKGAYCRDCLWHGVASQRVRMPGGTQLCPSCRGQKANLDPTFDNRPNPNFPIKTGPKILYDTTPMRPMTDDEKKGIRTPYPVDAQVPNTPDFAADMRAAIAIDKNKKPVKDMRVRTFEEKQDELAALRRGVAKEMGWDDGKDTEESPF